MTEINSHWRKAALTAGLCLLLAGCGGGLEAPQAYVIGENNTVTLDSVLTSEEGGAIVAASVPSDEEEEGKDKDKEKEDEEESKDSKDDKGDKKDKKDKKSKDQKDDEEAAEQLSEQTEGDGGEEGEEGEEAEEAPSDTCIYTYSGVTPGALDLYTDALRAKEEGFRIIDAEFNVQKQRPEYSSAAGNVTFARKAVDEEGVLFEIVINWSGGACIVTVQRTPGTIIEPVEEEKSSQGAPAMQRALTLTETVDYVRSLPPSAIGLEGSSMAEYSLIPVQGSPMVDGQVCRHLNVYQEDPNAGTNVFKGTYLVGGSGVYELDEATNEVRLVHSW